MEIQVNLYPLKGLHPGPTWSVFWMLISFQRDPFLLSNVVLNICSSIKHSSTICNMVCVYVCVFMLRAHLYMCLCIYSSGNQAGISYWQTRTAEWAEELRFRRAAGTICLWRRLNEAFQEERAVPHMHPRKHTMYTIHLRSRPGFSGRVTVSGLKPSVAMVAWDQWEGSFGGWMGDRLRWTRFLLRIRGTLTLNRSDLIAAVRESSGWESINPTLLMPFLLWFWVSEGCRTVEFEKLRRHTASLTKMHFQWVQRFGHLRFQVKRGRNVCVGPFYSRPVYQSMSIGLAKDQKHSQKDLGIKKFRIY